MVDQLGLANEWFVKLSEPVRVRKSLVREHFFFRNPFIGPYSQLLNDWYLQLSEPVRVRKPIVREPLQDFFYAPFVGPYRELQTDWYRLLAEPVRAKIPPPRGTWPFFVSGINYVEFTLAVTEQGDTILLSLMTLTKKNLARVTITEIETYATRVTIKEIIQGREYS